MENSLGAIFDEIPCTYSLCYCVYCYCYFLAIALHVAGSILISLYVVDVWSCDIYWTIFVFFW